MVDVIERIGVAMNPLVAATLRTRGRDRALGVLKMVVQHDSMRPPMTVVINTLKGRHVRVLDALMRAHEADKDREDLDPEDRGFRTAGQIAADYRPGEMALDIDAQAVRAYLCQINRMIRRATPPGMPPPRLFVTERYLGTRLVCPLAPG